MKVFSMFDGVGGFIIGLNNVKGNFFEIIYSNQYEPSMKRQDAYEVGCYRFPDMEHIPTDVAQIPDDKFTEMRDKNVEVIVGGFPCQDYSVARSKKNERGIEGKKGVLFWEIIRATRIIQPKYLILENVDRLLNAPSSQRGRDFAVMLGAFNELGYSVEWRIINAADYGNAQRRRRLFFFIYHNDTKYGKTIDKNYENYSPQNLLGMREFSQYEKYLFKEGLFASQFPINQKPIDKRYRVGKIAEDIVEISDNYSDGKFWNTGVMRHGYYYTVDTKPTFEEQPILLGSILQPSDEVSEEFDLTKEQIEKFEYLKGSKKIERTSAEGHKYIYSEGGMSLYDSLDMPARTMLTSEGTVNRSTHVVNQDGRIRFITPIEAERIQSFPDDWTKYKLTASGEVEEVSKRMRLFFMGNALVTTIVTRIGEGIKAIEESF